MFVFWAFGLKCWIAYTSYIRPYIPEVTKNRSLLRFFLYNVGYVGYVSKIMY